MTAGATCTYDSRGNRLHAMAALVKWYRSFPTTYGISRSVKDQLPKRTKYLQLDGSQGCPGVRGTISTHPNVIMSIMPGANHGVVDGRIPFL